MPPLYVCPAEVQDNVQLEGAASYGALVEAVRLLDNCLVDAFSSSSDVNHVLEAEGHIQDAIYGFSFFLDAVSHPIDSEERGNRNQNR